MGGGRVRRTGWEVGPRELGSQRRWQGEPRPPGQERRPVDSAGETDAPWLLRGRLTRVRPGLVLHRKEGPGPRQVAWPIISPHTWASSQK